MQHQNNNSFAKKYFVRFLILLLTTVRPLLGPAYCYFSLSCTLFAQQQLETKPFLHALIAILKRLIVCSPLYPVAVRHGHISPE